MLSFRMPPQSGQDSVALVLSFRTPPQSGQDSVALMVSLQPLAARFAWRALDRETALAARPACGTQVGKVTSTVPD
jgi:hypothetical protein